jgi:hypothetical protein
MHTYIAGDGICSMPEGYRTFRIHTYIYIHVHTYIAGDGICSMPEEYPGFGRFGCIKDCGRYKNTTKIYINMQVCALKIVSPCMRAYVCVYIYIYT